MLNKLNAIHSWIKSKKLKYVINAHASTRDCVRLCECCTFKNTGIASTNISVHREKQAVNSCISPDIFISPSSHLQHNFNKTQNRDTAQYWHHLITKTPVIHLQRINGSGALWKAFKAGEAMRAVTGEKNYTSQQIIRVWTWWLSISGGTRPTGDRTEMWEEAKWTFPFPACQRNTWLTWNRSHWILLNSELRCCFH